MCVRFPKLITAIAYIGHNWIIVVGDFICMLLEHLVIRGDKCPSSVMSQYSIKRTKAKLNLSFGVYSCVYGVCQKSLRSNHIGLKASTRCRCGYTRD